MSAYKNKGEISLIVINRARNNVQSRFFTRSSSAYPIGELHPKSALLRRQHSFSTKTPSSTIEDGILPGFSVGPCCLVSREEASESARVFPNIENMFVPATDANAIETIDEYTANAKLEPEIGDINSETSNSSNCNNMMHQGYGSNIDIQKVSLQNRIVHNRNGRYRNVKSYPRKGKQKSSKKRSKHIQIAKHKSTKDHNVNKRNTFSREITMSYQLIAPSNGIQPILSGSLPSIASGTPNSTNKTERLSSSEKYNCLPDDFNNKGNMQKPKNRVTKIYLSEKQSRNLMGVPAVPPCTPFLDEGCEIECIPSMSDIKSQRSIADKLSSLFKKQSKKEHEEMVAKNQKRLREERIKQKDFLSNFKRRQRAEIYALNAILSEVEKSNYEKFKEEKALPI